MRECCQLSKASILHVKWVPCHHGMTRPQVADGGDGLQIWRVAANILNKQSRTANNWWSSNLGLGEGITPRRKRNEMLHTASHLGRLFGTT
jgi:hypothetical protein